MALQATRRILKICNVCLEFENHSTALQKSLKTSYVNTDEVKMVTGTKGKLICVGLVFLAQLAKTYELDL